MKIPAIAGIFFYDGELLGLIPDEYRHRQKKHGDTMIRLIALSAALFALVACTPWQPPGAPQSAGVPAATGEAQQAPAEGPQTPTGESGDSLEVVEVPAVAKTATAPNAAKKDELVCWRERTLGSHRLEKICRFRSEIDAEREETQRGLREAQRGGPTLNNPNE